MEREVAGLGRRRAAAQDLLGRCAGLPEEERRLLAVRVPALVRFQDLPYAARYVEAVLRTFGREREALGPRASPAVTREVVRGLFQLMAYKDEYEVARLHLEAAMHARAEREFTGRARIHYHLHPPWLRALGMRRKIRVGRWMEIPFRALAAMKGLRGTALDPFRRAGVRRLERRLVVWYEESLDRALRRLGPASAGRVAEIARLPELVRGFEQVKVDGASRAMARAEALLRELEADLAAAGAA